MTFKNYLDIQKKGGAADEFICPRPRGCDVLSLPYE